MKTQLKVKLVSGENALKQVRQALGMTYREFAKALGTYPKTIARWEKGETKPMFSVSQMKALQRQMEKVGLSLQDLPDDL